MNPLRLDPTRTSRLRAQLNSAMMARFNQFKKELQELLIKGNELGFKMPEHRTLTETQWLRKLGITANVAWASPSEKQVAELKKWLAFKTGQLFLKQEDQDSTQTWLGQYIKQVYQRGLKRAWDDMKRPTGPLGLPKEAGQAYQKGQVAEFMRQSFGGPIPVERVNILTTRAFNDLEGITNDMNKIIVRTLIDGMTNGLNPRTVGAELNKIVGGYKNRGTAIARSEMIRAFNEGALDGLENLGAKAIGVMVEWSTSGMGITAKGNPSPCKKCAPLANLVLTIEEARGLLPRHPNCMCSLIPANVGEKSDKQIRDATRIRAAIVQSARGDTRWLGRKKKIASRRPK